MLIGAAFSNTGAGPPPSSGFALPGLSVCGGIAPFEPRNPNTVEAATPFATAPQKLRRPRFFGPILVPPRKFGPSTSHAQMPKRTLPHLRLSLYSPKYRQI